jgi:hypothetical protein
MTCPNCKSTKVYRSRTRSIAEKLMKTVLPIHYYRCHHCNWRGSRIQKRKLGIGLIVILGGVFGYLLFELASPILRALLSLVFS